MTTLVKKASFTYDPGSPFVPSVTTVRCTGTPDVSPPPAPPVYPSTTLASAGFKPPYIIGYGGSSADFMVVTDRNGQKKLWPKPPSGTTSMRLDTPIMN